MNSTSVNILPVDFDPFRESETITVPTTEAQREILANILFGGRKASCAYNESVSLHIDGPFVMEALWKAIDLLVARHNALRAAFSEDGLWMYIKPILSLQPLFIDLTNRPVDEVQSKVNEILHSEAEFEFNLHEGPLGQIKLIRFSSLKHQLILTFHHIVCDGWSLGIMMKDLGVYYSSIVKNQTANLEEVNSFSDYALDEQNYQTSDDHKKAEDFWLDQYKGSIPKLELPLNSQRPVLRSYDAKRIDIVVNPEIIASFKKATAKLGVSFISALTCAFEIYLYRITGSTDIVVGLAAAGQSAVDKNNLVGHCVNLLPLRSSIDPRISFPEYITLRKSQILDAYDHQRYTFGSLIQKLNIPRDPGRIPLVPVSFNVDLGITNGVFFEECSFNFTTNPRHYENFEIFINAAGNGNELTLECTFNTDLFSEEMMQLRMQEFVELLINIVRDPSSSVAYINILTDWEKQKLFTDWQGTVVNYNSGQCIHQLFEEAAGKNPENMALVFGKQTMTYRELDERSNQMAHYLVAKGLQPDGLVALYMERSMDLVISLLAILKAGGAYVPIDISHPAERIHYVIQDTHAPFFITQYKLKAQLLNEMDQNLFIEDILLAVDAFPNTPPALLHRSSQLAYVIYTSGSTGKPKGVAIEHYTVVNYISWCNNYYFGNSDFGNFGLYSSLSFDLTVTSLFCSLTRGKTLTIFNQSDDVVDILKNSFGPDSTIDTIKMTPAHVMLLEGTGLNTNKICKAIIGGEELLPRHVEILRAINPSMEIVNEYGPTEATVGCIIKDVVEPDDATTIGKPIDNCEIYILDLDFQAVPPGVLGKIFIAGGGLARYYHNQPDLTDEKFQLLTVNGETIRMYDSGDLGCHRINGDISFLGRIDDQVKIRGYRIELSEIEIELSKLPNVKEQVVVVREDKPGDKSIVAYLVLNDNGTDNTSLYRDQLTRHLPLYMIPVSFIVVERFPLTVNGKVDRILLPAPGIKQISDDGMFKEPQTPVEQVLANIWCSLLGLERVGRKDNFFELGGHSILGVKMLNEVGNQLGVKINLSMLFSASSIEELARIINKERPSKPLSCLVPLQQNGSRSPLFCIHMHNGNVNRWRVMIKHLGPDQPVYAIQPLGLDINKNPHTSIEEMAAYYIQIMKEIQPQGPYNLIGLCFSGMVVFEMAAQLQKNGEKVAFLAMINNYAPPANPNLYRIKTGFNKVIKMEPGEVLEYVYKKYTKMGRKLMEKVNLLPSQTVSIVEQIQIDEPQQEIGHDLRTIHSLALSNYHPVHLFIGDLIIIRNAQPIEYPYDESLGWDRLIEGKIETTIIEGCDNDTIITDEPYNAFLSRKVKEYLDDIENQHV